MRKTIALILVGFLYALVVISNGEKECPLKQALAKSIDACKDKLSEENVQLLKDNEFAENGEIQCFKACVMNHAEIMKDKKIDIEKIRGLIKDEIEGELIDDVMDIIKTCKLEAEAGLDECAVAALFTNCFKDATDNGEAAADIQ